MNLLLNKLLVAVDFSKCSEKALRFAAEWSAVYGAKIVVLHVINDALPLGNILNDDQVAELKNTIEQNVKKFIDGMVEHPEKVEIILEKGKVYERITNTAVMIGADLILMGANGSSDRNSHYLGSNTMRTMRTCNLPVVVVSQHTRILAIESAVFPVDLSKDYIDKLKWGLTFSELNKNIRIHLLSVLKDSEEFIVNRVAKQLANAKDELKQLGVKHTAEMIKCMGSDTISRTITDYASKLEAGIIFILTHPESHFTPFYVSSLLQEIIALSQIPVMAVNPIPVKTHDKIKI